MNPPSELAVWLGTVLGAIFIGIAAVGNYIKNNKEKPKSMDTVLTSIGVGYGDRDQIERAIAQITRMASALEILADKRTDKIEQALERLDEEERRERKRQQEDWEHRDDPRKR
jgi:undecaprenyl pyrophosphate synthase